jgi:integrase
MNKLSATKVSKTVTPGRYGDGGGLWLQVTDGAGGPTKAWLFRFMLNGKARQMGLGSVDSFSLAEARDRARKARQLVTDGIDPIEAKRKKHMDAMAEDAKRITFKEAATRYIETQRAGWKNKKHGHQWAATLKTYAHPVIGELAVDTVDTGHILKILQPIWNMKTETAGRVRGRIEAVLDWATVAEYRRGDNPARWSGRLDKLLPPKAKVRKVKHHKAMPYAGVPELMSNLRNRAGISARALEFTILTAVRTGETIGARWSEVNFSTGVWTVPSARTKSGRDHRVPLPEAAVTLLKVLPRLDEGDLVFPGARRTKPLSNMAMLELLKGMSGNAYTVHGFRSSFRDWAKEQTNFSREIAELALAHVVKDDTEAAYSRGDALDKRRRLMAAWAAYCAAPRTRGKTESKVISMNA